MASRLVHPRRQLLRAVDLGDADAGTEVGRFGEAGEPEGVGDPLGDDVRLALPVAAQDTQPRHLGDAGLGEEGFGDRLVHRHGGTEDTGADVGDVRQFEHALDGAVLPHRTVEDGEDDVDVAGENGR